MGKILVLPERRTPPEPPRHLTGRAVCVSCGNDFEATAPVGVVWVECPKCGTFKGARFVNRVQRRDLHWVCACGNALFFVQHDTAGNDHTYCANCGLTLAAKEK